MNVWIHPRQTNGSSCIYIMLRSNAGDSGKDASLCRHNREKSCSSKLAQQSLSDLLPDTGPVWQLPMHTVYPLAPISHIMGVWAAFFPKFSANIPNGTAFEMNRCGDAGYVLRGLGHEPLPLCGGCRPHHTLGQPKADFWHNNCVKFDIFRATESRCAPSDAMEKHV